MPVFPKKCPSCGKPQIYKLRKNFNKAVRLNRICRGCMYKSLGYRSKHSENSTNMWRTPEHVEKLERIHTSDDYRERRRKLAIAQIKQRTLDGRLSGFSQTACKYIDGLNYKNGWNLQHALNGGEVEVGGFMMDGYDRVRGIVFEYDEPHHFRARKPIPNDVYRQNFLMERLKPKMFLRYNEIENRLMDVVSGKEIQ